MRLAELEYFLPGDAPSARSGTLGEGAGYDAEAKVKALWVWDLSQDLSVTPPEAASRRAWRLTRALAEGAASLLAAAWQRDPAAVRTLFVPLASAALERQVRAAAERCAWVAAAPFDSLHVMMGLPGLVHGLLPLACPSSPLPRLPPSPSHHPCLPNPRRRRCRYWAA